MKKEIKEIIDKHKVDFVFVTSDGNVFLPQAEKYAKVHAEKYGLKIEKLGKENPNQTKKIENVTESKGKKA